MKHPKMKDMILSARAAYIVSDSKHPNAAKLWGYWVVSPAGQKGMKLYDITYDWHLKNSGRLTKNFRKILRSKKK